MPCVSQVETALQVLLEVTEKPGREPYSLSSTRHLARAPQPESRPTCNPTPSAPVRSQQQGSQSKQDEGPRTQEVVAPEGQVGHGGEAWLPQPREGTWSNTKAPERMSVQGERGAGLTPSAQACPLKGHHYRGK